MNHVSIRLPAGPRDDLTDVAGIRVGHATVPGGGSGCTVVLGPLRARVEVMGLAAGSREFVTMDPGHATRRADAILLTGGSAWGLAAADGVMAWLGEREIGHPTREGVVPIVPAAVIFDLAPGRARPGPDEGRAACEDATRDARGERGAGDDATTSFPSPNIGAGAGARVGKLLGPASSSPGGIGSASVLAGGWTVGALAVVNAVGDIVGADGRIVAGARLTPDAPPVDAMAHLLGGHGEGGGDGGVDRVDPVREGENTTLAIVATDAPLTDADLRRFLRIATTALPRRITPVFTPFDGDVVFGALPHSTPDEGVPRPGVEVLTLGVAAREALDRAILRAVGVSGAADTSGATDTRTDVTTEASR